VPLVDEVEQWLNASTMSRRERKKRWVKNAGGDERSRSLHNPINMWIPRAARGKL
jgi:hypothetical protein